ncbi:hypothetical protein ACFVYG_33415 [Streptomyces sp. NPDC058256]|uniref:hypothetical protein n=1 Tax=Streptomyces sp. NPDC058256 TaxID=3346408 RepID=UPI0036E92684
MAKAKLRKQRITSEEFSGASIAGLVVTVGYNLGPATWSGKVCIWSSPVLVLLLPIVFAALLNRIDNRLVDSQYRKYVKELKRMVKDATNPEHRAEIEKMLHATEKDQAQRLRKLAASQYEEASE